MRDPIPQTSPGPAFSQNDLPGEQPAPPTCNHLSLQVYSPRCSQVQKGEGQARVGPGVLQARPKLQGSRGWVEGESFATRNSLPMRLPVQGAMLEEERVSSILAGGPFGA